MTFMKRSVATWHVSLMADCPYCSNYTECMMFWHEQEGYNSVQVGESKELEHGHGKEDLTATCDKCNKEFVISHTEY